MNVDLITCMNFMTGLKKRAEYVRRFVEPSDGSVTPSSTCLVNIEADIEEFLNQLLYNRPELDGHVTWKLTPEFLDDAE